MSLKIKIQLWMNVQLWAYRPPFSGWGGVEFSYGLAECVVTSPASPGSLSYPDRRKRGRSWTVILGGPLSSFWASGWWWRDGVDSPFPACPGLWREESERRGWLRTPEVKLSTIIRTIIVK